MGPHAPLVGRGGVAVEVEVLPLLDDDQVPRVLDNVETITRLQGERGEEQDTSLYPRHGDH